VDPQGMPVGALGHGIPCNLAQLFFFLEHAGDNILSQKVTQSELDASPAVGNDSLPDPIPSTAAPPHPLTKVNTSYPAPELPTVGNSLGHRQLAILGCRKGRLSSAGDLQVRVLPSSVAMRLKDAAT